MKPIEDVFSAETFRRVIMPGIILALGIHPLISRTFPFVYSLYGIGPTTLFVVEIVIFGLSLSSALELVYYLYEGVVFEPLTSFARRRNEARVSRLSSVVKALREKVQLTASEQRKRDIAFEKLTDYPLRMRQDESVEYYSDSATRLGNIIATYELYAQTRYGVDGVFFWFHLLSLAPDNLRKEFGQQYAFAESLVLTSFSGMLVAILHFSLLGSLGIRHLFHSAVSLQFKPIVSTVLLLFGISVWLVFYGASLPAHREAGKMLQSLVDKVMPDFANWINAFNAPLHGATRSRLQKVRRYLAEPSARNAPSSSD